MPGYGVICCGIVDNEAASVCAYHERQFLLVILFSRSKDTTGIKIRAALIRLDAVWLCSRR